MAVSAWRWGSGLADAEAGPGETGPVPFIHEEAEVGGSALTILPPGEDSAARVGEIAPAGVDGRQDAAIMTASPDPR
jgi:hypothetical protein